MCDWSMSISLKHDRDNRANTNVMQEPCVITNVKTFSERLIWARERLGWTQEKLASDSGVGQSAIGNYESGLRKSSRQIVALARALGVRPEWLADGSGQAEAPANGGGEGRHAINEAAATYEVKAATWPFSRITMADVLSLAQGERDQLEGAIALAVAQLRLSLPVSSIDALVRQQKPGDILPIGSAANDEYAEVHRYDVKFAGGSGRISFDVDEKAKLAFRLDFLKSIGVKLKNAMIVYLQGDSHDPVIPSGSALLVDRGVDELHTLENGGKGHVYAFWWEKGLSVKRLVCQDDGAIMAYSYNPAFAPFQINKDTFKIIGRVKWMGTRL